MSTTSLPTADILPFQLPLCPALPQVIGNQDYTDFEILLERIDVLLRSSGGEALFVRLSPDALPAECKTDGLSLVSFLKGGAAPHRDHFYWELHEGKPIQAVGFGNWKAVKNGPNAALELHDLAADAGEKTDLAAGKPELVAKAVALMLSGQTPDPGWPLAGPAAARKPNAAAKPPPK